MFRRKTLQKQQQQQQQNTAMSIQNGRRPPPENSADPFIMVSGSMNNYSLFHIRTHTHRHDS